MKALLHLKDGTNETVELLINISERIGDIKEFVNAAYTNSYYEGELASKNECLQSLGTKKAEMCDYESVNKISQCLSSLFFLSFDCKTVIV